MKARTRALGGLVLSVVGLSAAGVLRTSEVRSQRPARPEQPTVSVIVAARDLAPGSVVTDADVKVVHWPAHLRPPNTASSIEDVTGRGVVNQIWRGEPLLKHRLRESGGGSGLPVLISAGQRALSVRVDEVIGVAGFIQPGAHVDVLVTAREGNEARSSVVLQDVRVLATGRRLAPDSAREEKASVITLAVTPEQAELLTLAANEGRIQLALRHPLDSASTHTNGADMGELMANSTRVPQPAPVARTPARSRSEVTTSRSIGVEVINGTDRAVTTFRESTP